MYVYVGTTSLACIQHTLSSSLSLPLFLSLSLLSSLQDEYVTQLQNQIKDLERYITFIQTARPKMSHDPHQESHDTNPHHQLPSPLALTNSKPKKVTFADDLDGNLEPDKVPLPSPLSRTKLVGPLVDKKRQPVPDYRLSMTQLDGVDCLMDNTMKEWEKVDSLGDPLLYDAVQVCECVWPLHFACCVCGLALCSVYSGLKFSGKCEGTNS